jgi:hypothetical protein
MKSKQDLKVPAYNVNDFNLFFKTEPHHFDAATAPGRLNDEAPAKKFLYLGLYSTKFKNLYNLIRLRLQQQK